MKYKITYALLGWIGVTLGAEQEEVVKTDISSGSANPVGFVTIQPGKEKQFDIAALQAALDEKNKWSPVWRINKFRGVQSNNVRSRRHHNNSCPKEAAQECSNCVEAVATCIKNVTYDCIGCSCCPCIFCVAQTYVGCMFALELHSNHQHTTRNTSRGPRES